MAIFDFLFRYKKRSEKPTKQDDDDPVDIPRYEIVPNPDFESEEVSQEELENQTIYVPQGKGDLSGVTQSIWTYAPDEYEDMYWPTPIRPNMETDFEELRKGIEFVFRQKRFDESRPKLLNLVEEAYQAYKMGDREKGMELISQIQIMQGKMK